MRDVRYFLQSDGTLVRMVKRSDRWFAYWIDSGFIMAGQIDDTTDGSFRQIRALLKTRYGSLRPLDLGDYTVFRDPDTQPDEPEFHVRREYSYQQPVPARVVPVGSLLTSRAGSFFKLYLGGEAVDVTGPVARLVGRG